MTPVIRRLDHVIVAVRDRREWIPRIGAVLGLEPGRMLEGAGDASAAFNNAEFAIGDGFLGVVEPSGAESQLHRFLDRFGEGFYGMSIDVGDVDAALRHFDECRVPYHGRAGGLVWLGPRRSRGVLYQVIGGMLLGPGANPNALGLASMTVAVDDLDTAVREHRELFALPEPRWADDATLGARAAVFDVEASALGNTIVLAEPTDAAGVLADHLATRGEGMFSFAIAIRDLDAEVARLAAAGVEVERGHLTVGPGARLDPGALGGVRVELLGQTVAG